MNSVNIPITVGILSGGQSTRMGSDKALITLDNERMIDRLISELGDVGEVIISASKRGIYDDLGCPIVYDEHDKIGPIEGIRQVLSAADTEYVFVCAVDMPFIKKELIDYMAGYISSDHACYVIADEDHIHPLCAIYRKDILPVIDKLIAEGNYRLREIFKHVPVKYISLDHTDFDKKTVRNINTKAELLEVNRPLVFCVSGYSDSGKTWLTQKLINEFIKDGMTVGVIKHDGHDRIKDAAGSDTGLYKESGAICTAVFSDSGNMQYYGESVSETDLIERMKSIKSPPDVIIMEGLKKSSYPKVEVIRKDVYDKSVCDESTLICISTDCISPKDISCPVFDPEDVRGIILCIKKYFDQEIT